MASLYCQHERLADVCEDCAAQRVGLRDAQDGPAARLPGREQVDAPAAESAPPKRGRKGRTEGGPALH